MLERKVYILCPVRNITNKEKKFIEDYVAELESKGYKVHYPPRDVNQDDPIGLNICSKHRKAMKKVDEVHVYWTGKSEGSRFDFGMAFMANKPIILINRKKIKKTSHKSFENVLLELDSKYRKS